MKNFYSILTAMAVAVVSVSPVWGQAPALPRYYGIEHGIIVYSLSGSATGKETLYFDQFGARQSRQKTAQTPRYGNTVTVTLNLGVDIIFYDPDKNLGQKKTDEILKKVMDSRKDDDQNLLSMEVLSALGAQKSGDETFMEKSCEIWEAPKLKAWVWNGVLLKYEQDLPDGKVIYAAQSVDETTPVDENLFIVPERVHFIDRDINQILLSQRRVHENRF